MAPAIPRVVLASAAPTCMAAENEMADAAVVVP